MRRSRSDDLGSLQEDQKLYGLAVLTGGAQGVKYGVVVFEQLDRGTLVRAAVWGQRPGLHGFHVHRMGDLSRGCESLCEHFDVGGHDHGGLNEPNSHTGDLGNLLVGEEGEAEAELFAERLTLAGDESIYGRSVIFHADQDDLGRGSFADSKTTGHSGKRVLCGVIGRYEPSRKC